MTIRLNVQITVSNSNKYFSVWSDKRDDLPYLDNFIGHGESISEAIDDMVSQLPDYFHIDDETQVISSDITYTLKRPFRVAHRQNIRTFHIC